jgi:hypothetical protein
MLLIDKGPAYLIDRSAPKTPPLLVEVTVARAAIEARRDFHCVIPLTLDPSVVAAEGANVNNIADPNTTLRDGVVQKFRVVLGSGELPTATTVNGQC